MECSNKDGEVTRVASTLLPGTYGPLSRQERGMIFGIHLWAD
ncbi:MAG: hypothetical protein KatS3mg082_0027 [Nitrospiraceae bacterium]|nr:MAG: hypothetical protein KatS3mg082_0027 [Nitrospiraceae bacterium]